MKEEKCAFDIIYDYVKNKENKANLKTDVFKLVFEKKTFNAKYFDESWMDNGLEKSDPNYKEYHGLYFKNIEGDKFIEISKLKSPKEVFLNDVKIY